eukprot:scaffold22475_cov69-Cylindrotheca_fusiformis.AAC.2
MTGRLLFLILLLLLLPVFVVHMMILYGSSSSRSNRGGTHQDAPFRTKTKPNIPDMCFPRRCEGLTKVDISVDCQKGLRFDSTGGHSIIHYTKVIDCLLRSVWLSRLIGDTHKLCEGLESIGREVLSLDVYSFDSNSGQSVNFVTAIDDC